MWNLPGLHTNIIRICLCMCEICAQMHIQCINSKQYIIRALLLLYTLHVKRKWTLLLSSCKSNFGVIFFNFLQEQWSILPVCGALRYEGKFSINKSLWCFNLLASVTSNILLNLWILLFSKFKRVWSFSGKKLFALFWIACTAYAGFLSIY